MSAANSPSPTGKVYPLKDNQKLAVDPSDSVWLSASAGTGKTQVLSARVLRLLLEPRTRPEEILCLTFTKAGAAEMATRVNEVLANWVRMKPEPLGADLIAIGADARPETIARARTLFASVLDCPGGGLRIDTIHAFAQWLLAAFPEEAGLQPGTRPMEDRDREILAGQVLGELVAAWQGNDPQAIAALEMLSLRLGPADARGWLMRCAMARDAWFGAGAWQPPMRGRVERLIGLEVGANAESLAKLCSDEQFDMRTLCEVRDAYLEWGTKSADKSSASIIEWIALDVAGRFENCAKLATTLFNKEGALKYQKNLLKASPDAAKAGARLLEALQLVCQQKALLDLVKVLTPALEIGRKYALAWDEAKQREGLVDFDDLIQRAADLLKNSNMSDWIRYKLDRQFDHILVDEAQDTNAAQWAIIDALTDDFFTGLGGSDDKLRTIFVVGDYKQAIFGFQGTSPKNFAIARDRYAQMLSDRGANAAEMRKGISARELQDLGLGRSYRTAQNVLSFVDQAIEAIGYEAIGLDRQPESHMGADRAGIVSLWNPILSRPDDDADDQETGPELGISDPERRMADALALQVKQWIDNGFALVKGDVPRNAKAGDIMVLVRKRRELAGLIVARLHAAGVPVAGVDRLRLGAPIVVKDLLAALRFSVQPGDDLSLASLLVSPLLGWSQEQLLEHGFRDKGVSLWRHLRNCEADVAVQAVEKLKQLLALADYEPPQALLHWLLVGPWQGRRKLLARLGREAQDPIDELLNAAHQFTASNTPSLHGFIHWFDSGDGELKREAEGAGDLVRVMTVHGSKGLQAPIVILADACGNPDNSRTQGLELEEDILGEAGRALPILPVAKDQRAGRLEEASNAASEAEREEHWRLLYVAMTRAEEALFIGGSLGKKEKEPAADSWYARLAPLFGDGIVEDTIWGGRQDVGALAAPVTDRTQTSLPIPPVLPDWATKPIGEEPRPPRPLAPSSAVGEDQSADPPLPAGQAAIAARRGVLIHALLERLPDAPEELRESGGRAWLARQAADLGANERDEMLKRALDVLNEEQWRDLFGPDALAEVPLSATVGQEVIIGTADRLLITKGRVLVADFKTARRPPKSLEAIPSATLAQMAAYVAALEVIYPERKIEAAVLYTQTPQLIALPDELLTPHKPR